MVLKTVWDEDTLFLWERFILGLVPSLFILLDLPHYIISAFSQAPSQVAIDIQLWQSAKTENLFTEKHLRCSSPSLPQFLSNHRSSSGFMGKSLLCSEAPQSATSPCSCYHLLLDSLMSFSRRQCSHSVCWGQVLLSLEPSGYWWGMRNHYQPPTGGCRKWGLYQGKDAVSCLLSVSFFGGLFLSLWCDPPHYHYYSNFL